MDGQTRIKICGVTRVEDARLATDLGAAAIGLNFVASSVRYLQPEQARTIAAALPPTAAAVGVFANAAVAEIKQILALTGIQTVQLHGAEPPEHIAALAPIPVVKAFRWHGAPTREMLGDYLAQCDRLGVLPVAILLDTYQAAALGGTGTAWSWAEAANLSLPLPLWLAGGLNAANVAQAIAALRPAAVDVAGGVESAPGRKDPERLAAFVQAVKAADRRKQA